MIVDSIFAFSRQIFNICCFIISFAYCCCISVLLEVDMDCIIHVNMSCLAMDRKLTSSLWRPCVFVFVVSLFSPLVLLLSIPSFFAIHSTILSFFFICFSFFVPTGQFSNEQHLPYTSCWSHHLKKGLWRSSLLGQTRIGTWACLEQTHSNGRT